MELTSEEIDVINALREKKTKEIERLELVRRQQAISASIANLVAEAKICLQDAKRIAEDNNMQYTIESMVSDMINEVSNGQAWYGSDQSLC